MTMLRNAGSMKNDKEVNMREIDDGHGRAGAWRGDDKQAPATQPATSSTS
jgi:hypothetical protein